MNNRMPLPEEASWRYVQKVISACERLKMQVTFRQSNLKEWDDFLALQPFIPIVYANDFIDYQLAWSDGHAKWLKDLSIIVHLEGRPVAVWPLCLRSASSGIEIGSNEGSVLPPLVSNFLSPRSKKKVYVRCYALISEISAELRTNGWTGIEYVSMQYGFSDWHMMLMKGGAKLSMKHDLYMDLSLELSEIKSRMRKSYRSLLTSGERFWNTEILRVHDKKTWREFQSLHRTVAGRQTRSQETWDLQLRSISLGKAFLILLRDGKGNPVGGGFFQFTRDEAFYSVGAYDRSLFDKPLGHVVQWNAIKELKRIGVRWYRIGERTYRYDNDYRSDKMLSISHFIEGFSTHCFPRAHTSNKSVSVITKETCLHAEITERVGNYAQ